MVPHPFESIAKIVSRMRGLFRRDAVAGEIHDELEFHMQMRIEEYERSGMSRSEAERIARRRFGNLAVHKDKGYDVRGGGVMETILQDIRYAIRLIRQQPGFSAAAILTLAIGIAGSTAAFSVIDAAVLRPLPFVHSEQLMVVTIDDNSRDVPGTDPLTHELVGGVGPSLLDVQALAGSGAGNIGIASWYPYEEHTLVNADTVSERVSTRQIGEHFLELHGVSPSLGRSIESSDAAVGAPAVVMLGHAFWRSRFGGDPTVIGRTMRLPDGIAQIVGVAPAGFYRTTAVWRPMTPTTPGWESHRGTGTATYARLRPGTTAAAAAREMTAAIRARAAAVGDTSEPTVTMQSLYTTTTAGSGATLLMLTGAVACVLLLACVNVAGLLLARGAARRQEFAVRSSLGAGRTRLIRQVLTEGLVLALVSWLAAVILAGSSINSLLSIVPFQLPDNAIAAIDARALAFAAAISLSSCVAFALWPAVSLSQANITMSAQPSASRHGAPLGRRATRAFLASEVAIAMLLLSGAGLLIRSFAQATKEDPGFASDSVVVIDVQPLDQRPAVMQAFFTALLARMKDVPGVAHAGATDLGPFSEMGMVGAASLDSQGDVMLSYATMLPGSIEAVGLTLAAGRWPTVAEFSETSKVAILNEAAARELSPGRSAIGRQLKGFGPPRTIVGIMRDVRQEPMSMPRPQIVIPSDRAADWPLPVVMKPSVGQRISADVLRRVAMSVDPYAFVGKIQTASALHGDQIATPRQRAQLFGVLGLIGLSLTLVGIFGITAYLVARRTTEIGIRMALGAMPAQAVADVLREIAWPAAFGAAFGLIGAVASARALSKFLFETSPGDPVTLAAVAGILTVTAFIAAWLPARRAARVDPVTALRAE